MEPSLGKKKKSFQMVDLLLLITVIIWGINPTVVKISLREFSPFAFNAARYVVATVVCWVLLLWIEKDWRVHRKDLIPILVIGLFGNFVNQTFFIIGVNNTTAGNSSLIMAGVPMIAAIINGILKIEKISERVALGIATSFAGILLIILGSGSRISLVDQYFYGNLMMMGNAITWSFYTVINKKYLNKYSALRLTTYGVSVGTLCMLIFWSGALRTQDWRSISMINYGGMFYSGALSIAAGTLFWNLGIEKVGSTKTSLFSNVTPIVSVICGGILLQESFKLLQGAGALLIFAGLSIVNRKEIKETAVAAVEEQSV
ncbi:DMT family transporter [Geosporobacter ferrireducens]|uniref:EamA domain-containing protein n=1 Tax=Geosporobacter ferrireducens TaxID=1424294 RepID=A0A1D8GH88_9FIRM|nr:DMT family transporter [Geosporobacter ferrireducens]AOT70251.1 hypothetical protein Gferi_11990 [Geosporobacter ferrireducens]MTI55788.1 DMT family transporter [Geosporobacter ferrireducens]